MDVFQLRTKNKLRIKKHIKRKNKTKKFENRIEILTKHILFFRYYELIVANFGFFIKVIIIIAIAIKGKKSRIFIIIIVKLNLNLSLLSIFIYFIIIVIVILLVLM